MPFTPIDCHSVPNYLTQNMTHSWFTSSLYIVSEAYTTLSHLAVSNCFSKHRNSIFNFSITGYQSEIKPCMCCCLCCCWMPFFLFTVLENSSSDDIHMCTLSIMRLLFWADLGCFPVRIYAQHIVVDILSSSLLIFASPYMNFCITWHKWIAFIVCNSKTGTES